MVDKERAEKRARRLRTAAVGVLLVLGAALLAFGSVVWLDTSAPGPSTVAKTSTTRVRKPAGSARTTTTVVRSRDTTTPGKLSLRSEAVAATLFALGALLVLCGLFFNRITKVTLPGGGGFELGPESQAKVVAKAAETAERQGLPLEPQMLAALYRAALEELAMRHPAPSPWPGSADWAVAGPGWGPAGTSPGDDIIEAAVAAAAERVDPRGGDGG